MNENRIKQAGEEVAGQLETSAKVVWPWSRWKNWTDLDVQAAADVGGICFHSPGRGHDLTFFHYP
jgi:hypothetical protein